MSAFRSASSNVTASPSVWDAVDVFGVDVPAVGDIATDIGDLSVQPGDVVSEVEDG